MSFLYRLNERKFALVHTQAEMLLLNCVQHCGLGLGKLLQHLIFPNQVLIKVVKH